MSFEIDGKLYKKFDTEQKTDSFKAREFVIVISEDNYPQHIKFQLTQDRCDLIDPYEEGGMIKVFFDLRGREWNEKFFTNLNAWRVAKVEQQAATESDVKADGGFPPANDAPSEDFDDLPF